ncbi:MAG TPA: alternative ribosome rescue aminoacyl-tRNA hydrolase ArfB [Gemmatimonadaceae bacterium]|jgi:ribosome-associated protein|nr:alternative ribosome rescue aminoacyl-tRNA hydrolase ArfB [Gemmatimonadaceae bacterium]
MTQDGALIVNGRLHIPREELTIRASRAGGPGGQHVNTSSTRIEVVWNVDRSTALHDADRARLRERLATRIDAEGNLRVVAADSRSQRRNRDLAEARLAELVRHALVIPKHRRPTRPTKASVEARLTDKRRRSSTKHDRRRRPDDD